MHLVAGCIPVPNLEGCKGGEKMKLKTRRIAIGCAVLLATVMAIVGIPAFANGGGETGGGSTLPAMTYTAWPRDPSGEKYINNPNDVVSPWVEKKFNIKVSDWTWATMAVPVRQRFAQMAAADAVPDVIIDGKDNHDFEVESGLFADLTNEIPKMKNLMKYFYKNLLPYYLNNGKQYEIPAIELNLNDKKYASDPYNLGSPNWTMWVREDILAKAGYKFTSTADLQKKAAATGKKPTEADYAITPAIDTPAKFTDLLRKIKALNLKVGDKAVIPFSISSWQQYHVSSMFQSPNWHKYADGTVAGFLGSPGAKDFYKWLWTANKEGLIDPDWLIQKEEQLQDKAASGQVAVGMYLNDINAARGAMAKVDPSYTVRYLPWPKVGGDPGYYDTFQGGFERAIVSKKVKDIPRLLQYFDWFYSDEGLDMLTWGPKEAGLWKMQGDKKVFADPQVQNDMLHAVKGGKGADYYGLFDYSGTTMPFLSRVAIAAPRLMIGNPVSYVRSYPPNIDVFTYASALFGSRGMDYTGKSIPTLPGDNGQAVLAYYWSKFTNDRVSIILKAASDAEFNAAWNAEMQVFNDEGKYPGAIADAKKWFADNGVK